MNQYKIIRVKNLLKNFIKNETRVDFPANIFWMLDSSEKTLILIFNLKNKLLSDINRIKKVYFFFDGN